MSKFPDWLEGARAAPSRYNSQPWRFAVQPNGDIEVGWDAARTVPASDPTDQGLFLSLGAAIESACLRAAAADRPLEFVPAGTEDTEHVGRLASAPVVEAREDKRLAQYLSERHTARSPHLQFAIPPVVQLALRRETVGWGCRLHIESDRGAIRRIAALARQAAVEQYDDPEIRAEMARWYRLAPADPENCQDGLTAECLELRGFMLALTRWALNANSNGFTRRSTGRVMALREWNNIRRTGAFCLLTAQSTDRADMVRAGRLLIRLWLLAVEAGLTTHAVSSVLQPADLRERCLELFNAQGSVPACLFRVGFTPPVAASPRLSPAQLLLAGERPAAKFGTEARR
ncbi:MAG TPA: hypothetical protein VIO57_03400 [Chloroflexota bacterium]